jgi:hypothetical protein
METFTTIPNTTMEQPTIQLRWYNGVLQQAYVINTHEAITGRIINCQLDWRVVPKIIDSSEDKPHA